MATSPTPESGPAEPPDELAFAGLRGQAELLAAGEISSAELVRASLQRIERSQPALNCFRAIRADGALADAAEADRRLAAGERAPLLGVPVAIKDDTDLAGFTTPFGCPGDFPPALRDAELVRRLRAAGAVIVGKTATPEVGQWPITESRAFGVTRNPYSREHTPGGSSGGSAAAVAAGLVAAAVGSDGAGSVRIPAAWNHLVGIKTQRGRISSWPRPESFHGLAGSGPIARTVEDAALLLDALRGNHPGDAHRPPPPDEPYARTARRAAPRRALRIALALKVPFSGPPARLDPRVRERVAAIAGSLRALGHQVIRADPLYGLVGLSFMPRSMGSIREWVQRNVPAAARRELDRRTRENVATGARLAPLLGLARALERPLRAQVGAIFRRFDVVLAPTTAQPPLRVGAIDGLSNWGTDKVIVAACPYTWPWNVVGLPAVNVPAGLVDGLPVGAQLLGPARSESLLVALAAQLESRERWHERRPPG